MSALLINESPLQVLPSLAKAIGLNEAIVLQQIHYWVERSGYEHEQSMWFYKTDEEFLGEFSFWSAATFRRALKSLQSKKLLKVDKLHGLFKGDKFNRTKWYTVNYDSLAEIERTLHKPPSDQNDQIDLDKSKNASDQDDHIPSSQNDQLASSQNDQLLVETTTETTAEITDYCASDDDATLDDDGPDWISAKGKKLTGNKLKTFQQFWESFDYRKGRAKAIDAWLKIQWTKSPSENQLQLDQIIRMAQLEAMRRPVRASSGLTPIYPEGWISQRRWEDEPNSEVLPAVSKADSRAALTAAVMDINDTNW